MKGAAQRELWDRLELPDKREWFELPALFTLAEAEQIRRGFMPQGSDDRWLIHVVDDALYCHRSWTGACIFGAQIEQTGSVARLTRCWVSRDEAQYNSENLAADRELFADLIRSHLLRPSPN